MGKNVPGKGILCQGPGDCWLEGDVWEAARGLVWLAVEVVMGDKVTGNGDQIL